MAHDTQLKKKAAAFAKYWNDKGYEKGESQTFWNMLLRELFSITDPEQYIEYEDQVMMDTSTGFIDAYMPKTRVLIEQKSKDKDLRKAIKQSDGSLLTPFEQAKKYIVDLPVDKHPKWVITCNFKEFNIYDMNNPKGEPQIIYLKDLPKEYYRLSFLVSTENVHLKKEMDMSFAAGDIVGELYRAFAKQYPDLTDKHAVESLNKLCVRIVFCLYAEDAGLFKFKNQFHDYLNGYPAKFMRQALIDLFKVLDTEEDSRSNLFLSNDVLAFPYVNGGLFSDQNILIPIITDEIRDLLLSKASDNFNWSEISPTIFGAVFESTLNPITRRSAGMHYTSIEDIHKVIDPLFLNELSAELEEIKLLKQRTTIEKRVEQFQNKLASLKFLDPAAGSGNFLTESYISLRKLENEALSLIYSDGLMTFINPVKVSISQFYGIEINDFAVSVAQTALWIAETQMKHATEDIFNINLTYLPLQSLTNIVEGNALTKDWTEIVPPNELNYIMGNPPFVGSRLMSKEQKADLLLVLQGWKNANSLDYVVGWYKQAVSMMKLNRHIRTALVSTNSITQGDQVALIWANLLNDGVSIDFAYRTFVWNSQSNTKAHVHCVIIGFSLTPQNVKIIYEGQTAKIASNINPYLIDAPNILVKSSPIPICNNIPECRYGSLLNDKGEFVFTEDEMKAFVTKEPASKKYFRPFVGAYEYINGELRYVLYLKGIDISELTSMPELLKRVDAVRDFRLKSSAEATVKSADRPTTFFYDSTCDHDYLLIPRTSSERRRYIPIGFMPAEIVASDATAVVHDADIYMFGILSSIVHMSWVRAVAGRLKSDYRYAPKTVYNTFPWPNPTKEQKEMIEQTGMAILKARDLYSTEPLSNLYGDRMYLYPELLKAHQQNDICVLAAYGIHPTDPEYKSESARVAMLMKLYQSIT